MFPQTKLPLIPSKSAGMVTARHPEGPRVCGWRNDFREDSGPHERFRSPAVFRPTHYTYVGLVFSYLLCYKFINFVYYTTC